MSDEKISNDSSSDDSDDFEDTVKCKIQRGCSSSQEKGNTGSKRRIDLVGNHFQDIHFRTTLPGKQNFKKRTHEDDSKTRVKEKILKSNESPEEKTETVLAKRRISPKKCVVVGDAKADVMRKIQKSNERSEEKSETVLANRRILQKKRPVVEDPKADVERKIKKSYESSQKVSETVIAKRRIVPKTCAVVGDPKADVMRTIQKCNESSEEKSETVLANRRILPKKRPVVEDPKADVERKIKKSYESSEEKSETVLAKRRILPKKRPVVEDPKADVERKIKKSYESSQEVSETVIAKRRIVPKTCAVVDEHKMDIKETIQLSNESFEEKRKTVSAKRRIVPKKDESKADVKEAIQKSNGSSEEKGIAKSKKRRIVLVNSSVHDDHIKKTLTGKQNLKRRTHEDMKNQPTASKLPLLNVTQSTQSEKKHLPSFNCFTELMVKVLNGSVENFLEKYPRLKEKNTWTKYRDTEPTLHIDNLDIIKEQHMNSFAIHNKQVVNMKLENHKIAASHPLSNGTRQRDVLTSDIKSMVSKSVGLIHVDNHPEGTGFRVGQKYIATCAHVLLKVRAMPHFINSGRISIEFGRKKYKQRENPNEIFGFQPTLAYLDNEHDFAVLELMPHEAGIEFPPALTLFGDVCVSEIHLVGHPGGRQMKEDSDVIPRWLPEHEDELGIYIQNLRQWSVNYFPNKVDYYKVLLDLPRKILFHTTFDMGSSGSPGFMIVDDKPCVVLMVRGGTPSCLYDNLFPSLRVEDYYKVEYGYAFVDIYLKMCNSKQQSDKNLSLDIFREWSQ